MISRSCPVEGCRRERQGRRATGHGGRKRYCVLHEKRRIRTGSPLGVRCASCAKVFETLEKGRGNKLCERCLDTRLAMPGWLDRTERERDRARARQTAAACAEKRILALAALLANLQRQQRLRRVIRTLQGLITEKV